MAAQGAHLASAPTDDREQPSIFEVLAQESLVYSLQPAVRHIIRVCISILIQSIQMVNFHTLAWPFWALFELHSI